MIAKLKLYVAFALGWLSVALVSFVTGARTNDAAAAVQEDDVDQHVIWQRIVSLSGTVSDVEKAAAAGSFRRQVMAPFEVVTKGGQRLFYVTPQREVEVYQGGKRAAVMSAATEIGTLWALSSAQKSAALTGMELTMKESDKLRMALGKEAGHGNYRLQFASNEAENVAAMGVSWENQGGAALIFDGSGNLKANMTAAGGKLGNVAVMAGNKKPVAILTQSGAGYLVLCSAGSCKPPMVEAMDGGGYGIVGTGPSGWLPGAGFVIAAGSVISGKH